MFKTAVTFMLHGLIQDYVYNRIDVYTVVFLYNSIHLKVFIFNDC